MIDASVRGDLVCVQKHAALLCGLWTADGTVARSEIPQMIFQHGPERRNAAPNVGNLVCIE